LVDGEKDIKIHFLPAHHWSGRGLFDINKSLWGSWMIETPKYKIYFAGDTGYAGHFRQISEKFSSIDIVLMPIGPEEPRTMMKDSHVGVDEALQAFQDLQAKHFIPMHWGTFKFGADTFDLPIKKLQVSWQNLFFENSDKFLHIVKCGEIKQF
jgi:L-ascorbate metabolism protein UlaG (beta-lactamase superfamily)